MTSSDLTAAPAAPATAANPFYRGMAVTMLAAVVLGFATSAGHRAATGMPPLPLHVVLHGILFAGWFVVFLLQTVLVATHRIAWHRRLGLLAAVQAVLMTVTGPLVAIAAARAGRLPGDGLAFMLVMIVDVIGFGVFVGLGVWYRRRAETHKRFMLLGTLSMLAPAISRWPFVNGNPALIVPVLLAFIAAAPIRDLVARRRMHPVSLWGGVALFLSGPLRFAIAQSEWWHGVARWLVS